MKSRLFNKYFFTTVFIIIFSIIFMLIILSVTLNRYFAKDKYITLSECCAKISDSIKKSPSNEIDTGLTSQMMNALSAVSGVDIFAVNNSGEIIACGCDEWMKNGECYHSDHTVPKSELGYETGKKSFRINSLNIYKNPHYVASASLYNSEKEKIGTVFSAAPLSSITNLLFSISKLLLVSAAFPIILMFFALYAMTYRLTKPLKLMSEASKAMAKGDFSRRIPVMSDDEIGELSVSFNQMTNSLAKLESMRKDFVANVSHELKTPMTTIGGFIDGILDGTIEPDKQKYYLGIVSDEVKRLSRIVQSMLSMSKLESGEFVLKPELFDFGEMLCHVVISQEQRIESKKLNITGLDEVSSVSLNADRDLIHQVLYNLVDNAIKFTDEAGTIDFKVLSENGKLSFTIKNTGKGIPEKELPYVFERFYKVDKSRSANKNSTGLGLYIVKTIIKTHGGSISVSSRENSFTAFTVILPT